MASTHWLYIILGYFVLFAFGLAGIAYVQKKRRKLRPPLKFKLLRGPGETLRRRIAKYDETSLYWVLLAAVVPITSGYAVLRLLIWLKPQTAQQVYIGVAVAAVVFLVTLYLAGRWALRGLSRYSGDWLGYMGEREVAEHLSVLLSCGFRVYHDVPAENGGKKFNLDHVAVGPSGVAVIETKTRRKGRARPGFKDHIVVYDGRQLIWPWGEDQHGLAQARAEAEWLKKWLRERTGIETPVKPILTLPGWYVEAKARGDVTVVTSKLVASAVQGRGPAVLSADQVDLIARQLDVICRDVED